MKSESVFQENPQAGPQYGTGPGTDPRTAKFTAGFYVQSVTRLLGEPKAFFSERAGNTTFNQSIGFLVASSLFFTICSLISNMYIHPFTMGLIFFVNGVGMTLIAAALGYLVMIMIMGRKVPFANLFTIYTFASGITLLAAWVPFFDYLTEPWKWWLIAMGMTRSCRFSWKQTIIIILVSVIMMTLFFWSAIPIIAHLKQSSGMG